jgi:CHAT domain-containing protein/Flp pilus assembly protein TadD
LLSSRRLTLAILPVVAGYLSVSCSLFSHKPAIERGTEALVKAYSKKRMIEPRMCGGFHAGKYNPDSGSTLVDKASLEKAQDLILREVGNRGDAPALLARGRLNLAMGRCQDALPLLKDASKGAPDAADAHNDLGACLLQTAKYEEALTEFDKATEINPGMIEARFNRGLCYQKMLLVDLARSELSPFLNEERDKSWKEEAKRLIDELDGPEVKPPSQVVAELKAAEDRGEQSEVAAMLDRNFNLLFGYTLSAPVKTYLESATTGNVEAARASLEQIKTVGKAFFQEKHDSIVADAADYLERLTTEDATGLLQVYKEYADARSLLASYNISGADAMNRVRKSFHEQRAPIWELFSAYNLASAYYEAGKYTEGIVVLQRMLPAVQARPWPFFLARVYYQLGIDHSLVGQDSLAVKYCDQALDACRQNHEPEAKTLQALSLPYWHFGDLDRAVACLRTSTYHFRFVEPSATELANNYLHIADIYRRRGIHLLAASYADEALSFALHSGIHNFVAQSSSFLAVERALGGNVKDAQRGLSISFDALGKMSGLRLYTEPLVLTRAGEVARQKGDFQTAIEEYSRAEGAASKAVGDASLLIDPLRGRARAYLGVGQFRKARSDLLSAVRLIENRRNTIEDKTDREHYLDSTQDVFDQIIALDLSHAISNTADGFAMAERSRARSLLDEISVLTSLEQQKESQGAATRTPSAPSYLKPLELRSVQSGLPSDMVLLEYSVTSTDTYIFAVRSSGSIVARSEAGADVIASLVNKYVSQVEEKAPLDDLEATGQILYKHVISPVEEFIGDSRYLCIVPDKSLHFLPFGALVDLGGKFVIERHTVTYAPSASVLIECLREGANRSAAKGEGVLAVGDPAFNRSEFSQLGPLTSAEREARTIAQFYEGSKSTVLTGRDATKAGIRTAMAACDVAHLAVHCLVDVQSPWLAGLVLADDNQQEQSGFPLTRQNGLMYLNDIYDIPLPKTRLVVLSACQSAVGQYYKGEGIVSLVHPFIANHVPTVVATLWSVESNPTADLMVEFHKLRKLKQESTADALREAQLQMALGDQYRHPYYWAPFIMVGSQR